LSSRFQSLTYCFSAGRVRKAVPSDPTDTSNPPLAPRQFVGALPSRLEFDRLIITCAVRGATRNSNWLQLHAIKANYYALEKFAGRRRRSPAADCIVPAAEARLLPSGSTDTSHPPLWFCQSFVEFANNETPEFGSCHPHWQVQGPTFGLQLTLKAHLMPCQSL
jgi:hypothetical protein